MITPSAPSVAVADLRAAFQALAHQPLATADLSDLQPVVCAVVDEMMSDGVFPERIIITIRRLATESGVDWENDQLSEPLIRWCLRRYFQPGTTGK